MSDLNESFEQGAIEAEARGCTVLVAESHQLFIDLDSAEAVNDFDKMLAEWNRRTGSHHLEIVDRYYSSSGAPKQHVVLEFSPEVQLPFGDRLALQAILGSDPRKEALTLLRFWTGNDKPIRLFKPADAVQIEAQPVSSRVDALLASLEPIDAL